MVPVPSSRGAPTISSSRAPAHLHPAKRAPGRMSRLVILTGLWLVVAPMLTADASACTPGRPQCPAGRAADGHGSSTAHAVSGASHAASSSDPTPASTDHAVDPSQAQGRGNHGSHVTPDPTTGHAGSSSAGHHGPSGGPRHSPGHARPKVGGGRPGTASHGVATAGAIERVNPPAADVPDAAADGRGDLPHPVVPPRSPRIRMTDGVGVAGTVEQVAGALRFPASLLGVILLFLALQQRADRRDPKLAKAPIAARQETLEFR